MKLGSFCPVGLGTGVGLGLWLATVYPVMAQTITGDGSIGTQVTPGPNYVITGGQLQGGTTLFHSFTDFSLLNSTDTAHFDLGNVSYGGAANNVNLVIGRVTGGNLSTINGQITLTGGVSPDLFLINPSGFVFGAGASLNVPGSFLASTAENVIFANNVAFGIGNTPNPLLTITAPTGLQFGSPAAPITVQGGGSSAVLTGLNPTVTGLNSGATGLQVTAGNTLALVGGDVALNGGLVRAPNGRIELGSVTSGRVDLAAGPQGFQLSYGAATGFGSLQMTQRALVAVQATGTGSGAIQLQGRQVSLLDGSIAGVQNLGSQPGGDLTVNATESFQAIGMSSNFASASGLFNEAASTGAGGNILLNAPQVTIDQGGFVLTRTLAAPGGRVAVQADNVFVGGPLPGVPNPSLQFSVLLATTYGSGAGGDFRVNTQNLTIAGGANVGTRVLFGSGTAGDVHVQADSVNISSPGPDAPGLISLLSANTFGSGDAGNLYLNTRTLSIQDGGLVSVSTVSTGNAGSLFINASESIDVSGVKDADNPSYIGALARTLFGSSINSPANAGNITITTPRLSVRNGGAVFVDNQVAGNAGTLSLNANTVFVDNGSRISAATRVGEGGNLNLQLRDGLIMRRGSLLSATAGGVGNGGNITLNARVIAGFENSDIIANAVQGNGGNITITTQGIFGLEFRPQLTPENDITASSQFGLSGTVTLETPNLDPSFGTIELPSDLTDASNQVAAECGTEEDSRFVATGRGGLPPTPEDPIGSSIWADLRDLSEFMDQPTTSPNLAVPSPDHPITEAVGWVINTEGQVELVAISGEGNQGTAYATCAVSDHT